MTEKDPGVELRITDKDILKTLERIDAVDRILKHSEVFNIALQNSVLLDIEVTDPDFLTGELINIMRGQKDEG